MHDHDESELRILRERVADLGELLDQEETRAPSGACVVVKTVVIGTYPTGAQAYYGVQAQTPGGTEAEGQTGTLSPAGVPFLAFNVGGAKPSIGAVLIAREVGGRWVFRFNG